jgi:hypothetical protein
MTTLLQNVMTLCYINLCMLPLPLLLLVLVLLLCFR